MRKGFPGQVDFAGVGWVRPATSHDYCSSSRRQKHKSQNCYQDLVALLVRSAESRSGVESSRVESNFTHIRRSLKANGNPSLFLIVPVRYRSKRINLTSSSLSRARGWMVSTMGSLMSTAAKAIGLSPTNSSHIVHVTTGNRRGAGTDANVWIMLRDEKGTTSQEIKLNHWLQNDHERNQTCSFSISDLEHLGRIVEVELWRDSFGVGDAWFVDRIEVENKLLNARHYFPLQRWVKPHLRYVVREFDCCLPQDSAHAEQRAAELEEKKKFYEYAINVQGGPAQIKNLPPDESFSGEYFRDLLGHKSILLLAGKIVQWTVDGWKSLDSVKNVYRSAWSTLKLEEPHTLCCWFQDEWFGLQRVQGCDPVLIQLCQEIPDKFGVTEDMIAEFLEGLTLDEALQAKRLFIVDLKILEDLPCNEGLKLCSPLALFFLNSNKDLMPIAIQLFQNKGPKNPVFLPSDPHYTWLLAKMYYNNADAIYHQAYTHLGFTHLIMEGTVICTHRNLSPSHPLFRLMAPHFLFLLAINTRGLDKLVSEGGWVDRTMTCGRNGMFELIRRGLNEWRLDVQGTVPTQIANRGVIDPEILPHYPYRDDAVAIFNAIHTYVTKVVNHYYTSNEQVVNDQELQAWRKEMVMSRDDGGVGMLGVPGEAEGFTTAEQVTNAISAIISVCSIGHAAANFQQYHEYAFPPNYPAKLSGEIPTDKTELTEADVLQHLPDKKTTVDVMVITNLLSSKGTKSLGDFEVQYMYDPAGLQAAIEFRAELKKISTGIKSKNYDRKKPYLWLDPEIVPNAISI